MVTRWLGFRCFRGALPFTYRAGHVQDHGQHTGGDQAEQPGSENQHASRLPMFHLRSDNDSGSRQAERQKEQAGRGGPLGGKDPPAALVSHLPAAPGARQALTSDRPSGMMSSPWSSSSRALLAPLSSTKNVSPASLRRSGLITTVLLRNTTSPCCRGRTASRGSSRPCHPSHQRTSCAPACRWSDPCRCWRSGCPATYRRAPCRCCWSC